NDTCHEPRLEPPRTTPHRAQNRGRDLWPSSAFRTIGPSRKNLRERSEPSAHYTHAQRERRGVRRVRQTRFRFRVKVQSCGRSLLNTGTVRSNSLLFGYVSSCLSRLSISMRDYYPLSQQLSPR